MLVGIELINYALFPHLMIGLCAGDLDTVTTLDAIDSFYPLPRLVAIVGKNDSGKSALFGALNFLSDCLLHDVAYAAAVGKRGGFFELKRKQSTEPMELRVTFKQKADRYFTYQVVIDGDQHSRPYVKFERLVAYRFGENTPQKTTLLEFAEGGGFVLNGTVREKTELSDRRDLALAAYGKLLVYRQLCFVYAQMTRWFVAVDGLEDEARPGQTKGGHRHVSPRFDNINNVLQYWQKEDPQRYEQMLAYIRERVPDFKRTGDQFLDQRHMSGSMRLFSLLLLLLDPKPRPLICLDHPDNGLYHDAIDILTFEMREFLRREASGQIFFTTYNPNTVENLRPSEVYVLSRPEANGQVRAHPVSKSAHVRQMLAEGVGMAALWYGGYFEPVAD